MDALLLRRATDMTVASRDLNGSLVIVFHRDFAEQLLPALCERLEQARALAMAGRTVDAGRKYQALLVSSQVLAFAVAMQSMAQYADRRLQAGGQISVTQEKFAAEAAPILEAALSEDPRRIERSLDAHPDVFVRWAALLEDWPVRIDDGAHKAKVAMVVWDIAFLVVAAYEAAGAAAEMVAAEQPPIPPMPAFATAGGAAAAGYSGAAALELAETLRKLIALGALDAGVVAALSRPLMMSAGTERGGVPRSPVSASNGRANAAYETAFAGGRHAGLLRNYAGRSLAEIEKGIAGYERQVALHEQKIANPAQYAERWGQMSAQEQAGLIGKWQKDLARNQELADVLRGLAESMR